MPASRWWLYRAAPSGLQSSGCKYSYRHWEETWCQTMWVTWRFELTKVSWYHPSFWYLWQQTADMVQQQSPKAHRQQNHRRASGGSAAATGQHLAMSPVLITHPRLNYPAVALHSKSVVHSLENVTPAVSQLLHTHSCELSVSQLCDVASRLASGETSTHTRRYYTGNTQTQREKQTHSQTIQLQSLSRTLQWADSLSSMPEAFSSLLLAADTVSDGADRRDATQPDSALHTHLTKGLRS